MNSNKLFSLERIKVEFLFKLRNLSPCLTDLLVWIEPTLHSKNFLHDCFGISLFHGVILGFVHFQQFSASFHYREGTTLYTIDR